MYFKPRYRACPQNFPGGFDPTLSHLFAQSCKQCRNLGLGSHKIFSFVRKLFSKSLSHKMIVLLFLRNCKRERFLASVLLLIIIPGKMEGLASINMSKDS